MNRLEIFLVTYNKVDIVKEIMDRIYKYTTTPFNLIVADNNSSDGVMDYLHKVYTEKCNMTIIHNNTNRYACYATNQALKLCRGEYAIYMCSRECFVLDYGWEKDCIEFMDSHPKVGLAGYLIESPKYYNGETYARMPFFEKFRNREFALGDPLRPFEHVQGGFYIIRMDMVKEIGYFNELLEHNYMDVEYSYYAES